MRAELWLATASNQMTWPVMATSAAADRTKNTVRQGCLVFRSAQECSSRDPVKTATYAFAGPAGPAARP